MSVDYVQWTPEHEELLKLQRAKVALGGIRGATAATQILPGEAVPGGNVDFGVEDMEETKALTRYNPAMLQGGLASWITSPDGYLRQQIFLPGERGSTFYASHYAPHRAKTFRSNAMQFVFPSNAEGGIDLQGKMSFAPVETPYTNPRGPFMARHMSVGNEHRVLVGARHMDAIMEGANAYGMNQRMFGCPLPSYAQPSAEKVGEKKRRLNAHFAHVKNMKGIFSPATINHVANTENAFMTSLTDKVDAKMTSEVVQQLANTIPGVDAARAESIVKALQSEHAQRFGALAPNVQAPFSIYKSEVWHPDAHGLDSTDGYAFATDPSKIDYTSKTSHLFGRGIAIRYGDGKKHTFSNVYTAIAPAGQPMNTTPLTTTWYPHGEVEDAYIMQPPNMPQYQGVTFGVPISGSTGVAFLSV